MTYLYRVKKPINQLHMEKYNILDVRYTTAFYYKIRVKPSYHGDILEQYIWKDMSFDVYTKWQWYFRYRAALLQVKYPRFKVEESYGAQDYVPANLQLHQLRNKMIARKRKITILNNKMEQVKARMERAKSTWAEIFPIEDSAHWKEAVQFISDTLQKVYELENEIELMEIEIQTLINQQ